jgi:carboxypeptidase family protein/TonB-dependent receptor-like protein
MYRRILDLASALMLATTLSAQLTVSTIRGTAKDPTGAAVVGAAITVVNLGTNIQRAVVTNTDGDFEIPDLQRGTYRLTTTHPGFRNWVADNIILEANQIRRIDVTLELGTVGAEVTVRADAAVISTESAKIQSSFSKERFDDAPLVGDGRNPQMLMTTLPLVQQTGGVYGIQVAGQPAGQVQEGIDGHTGDGTSLSGINIHDYQEVVMVQGNNSAEYSRVGYFNFITKSGNNQFHGRAHYWHQNSALSAKNFFDTTKPKNLFHTMHADVSGPVRKDKTFFYVSWSAQRFPSSSFNLRDVPTNDMRRGDFGQLLRIARPVTIRDPLANTPFPANVIPASRINATSQGIQDKYIPAANQGAADTLANNYGFLFPYPSDAWHVDYNVERIDHKLSDKNTIYGRWISARLRYVLASTYPGLIATQIRRTNHFLIEDTHVFSPRMVQSFRFALYKAKFTWGEELDGFQPIVGDQVVKELGIQGVNTKNLSAMGFPRINITGYRELRVNPGGVAQDDKTWGLADTVTWSSGSHVLKMGAEYKPMSNFSSQVPEGTYGIFSFNGSFTGYGQSDFLLGMPFSSERLDPLTNRTLLDNELGVFVQDTYKVSSRLTLEMGLRWDRFGAASYEDGLVYNWDPASGNVIVPQEAIRSISPLYPTNDIKITTGKAVQSPSLNNFAPRLGVAYRPFGSNFVVRGAYGLYTATNGRYARAQGVGPYQLNETFFNSIQGGRALFAFPNPFPSGAGAIASQSISGFPANTENGRIHQFNLTFERQLRNIGLRLSYQGSRSRGLNYSLNINKPQPSLTAFSQARRPYPQFVNATFVRTDGSANFNALTLEAQRKFGQFTFDTHWTWASNYNNTLNLENPYAPLFWNRDAATSRHRVVFHSVWDLPVGRNRRYLSQAPRAVDFVLGGWQLYWIAYMETGQYFSPSFSGADPSNTNTSGGLPDRIANGNFSASDRVPTRWFDAAAFARPAAGRFGNSGVNTLEGPGLHEHNLTISKRVPITERFSFTFVAAMQNVFNHPNFNNPASNISAPGSVGVISSIEGFAPARQIMLRGRIDF